MDIRYSLSELPKKISKSIFLMGPTPRDKNVPSWRPEALQILKQLGYNGTVYVPEYEDGPKDKNFSHSDQIKWERLVMQSVDTIMAWVPRDLDTLPAFTTNVEFGLYCDSNRLIFGHPPEAHKMEYLDWMAEDKKINIHDNLKDLCKEAVERTLDAPRINGEVYIPSMFWNHSAFQEWYNVQVNAGHKIIYARPLWAFSPYHQLPEGKGKDLFCFSMLVYVHIPEENRTKVNEFIFGRTPVAQVLLYEPNKTILDTRIAIVKEFRSPAATAKDGFVYELPGGSSSTKKNPYQVILDEIYEETGVKADHSKLLFVNSRQGISTLSIHKVNLFKYELSEKEIENIIKTQDQVRGVAESSERTFTIIKTVQECISENIIDYATLGMILECLSS